jgi:hypothetical protein
MIDLHEVQYDQKKTCYEQNFEQFRSLNQTMWQVPVIGMTLTGGLWYGSANLHDMGLTPYLLLGLAAVADIGLVVVLTRIRYVMGCYLKKIKEFDEHSYVGAEGATWLHKPEAVAWTFRILLVICSLVSVAAIVTLAASADRQAPEARRVIERIELPR